MAITVGRTRPLLQKARLPRNNVRCGIVIIRIVSESIPLRLNVGLPLRLLKLAIIAALLGSTVFIAYALPPVIKFVVNQSFGGYTVQPFQAYAAAGGGGGAGVDVGTAVGSCVGAVLGDAVGVGDAVGTGVAVGKGVGVSIGVGVVVGAGDGV